MAYFVPLPCGSKKIVAANKNSAHSCPDCATGSGTGLEVGEFDQCYACRMPLSPEELESPQYTAGISCPHCYSSLTDEKKKSLTERQKQVILAKQRGEQHIGENKAKR